jgi:hypothetical protein
VDTAVAAPFKMRMLAPLKIWKWLKIAAEATTEDTAAAALGTDTPVVTATTEAHREAVDTVDTDTAAAAPLKRLLAPLKIWKWLNITTKATEASTVAALGTTPTEGAAAVMADPAADMAVTLDMVAASTPDTVVDINTKTNIKRRQTSTKRKTRRM